MTWRTTESCAQPGTVEHMTRREIALYILSIASGCDQDPVTSTSGDVSTAVETSPETSDDDPGEIAGPSLSPGTAYGPCRTVSHACDDGVAVRQGDRCVCAPHCAAGCPEAPIGTAWVCPRTLCLLGCSIPEHCPQDMECMPHTPGAETPDVGAASYCF